MPAVQQGGGGSGNAKYQITTGTIDQRLVLDGVQVHGTGRQNIGGNTPRTTSLLLNWNQLIGSLIHLVKIY